MMYESPFHPGNLGKYSFLVTGGAGFVGSHIVEYLLKHGAGKVTAMDNLSTGSMDNVRIFENNAAYRFLKSDICDAAACLEAAKGKDFIFHQAALGSVPRSIKDPLATNDSNVNGFLNILTAARECRVKRVVYASSSSVFGDSPVLPKTEDHLGNPLSPYAVTKRTNELYAQVFSQVYRMEIIGLRYFNIYGPRQNPEGPYAAAIPLFMKALLDNEKPFINGDGEQSRDFTFVENAVQANIRAIFASHEGISGQVFNVAVGERITVNELYHYLKSIAGSDLEPVYRSDREGDVRHSLADISKARNILGYEPAIRVEEGLGITWAWFAKQHQKNNPSH